MINLIICLKCDNKYILEGSDKNEKFVRGVQN